MNYANNATFCVNPSLNASSLALVKTLLFERMEEVIAEGIYSSSCRTYASSYSTFIFNYST